MKTHDEIMKLALESKNTGISANDRGQILYEILNSFSPLIHKILMSLQIPMEYDDFFQHIILIFWKYNIIGRYNPDLENCKGISSYIKMHLRYIAGNLNKPTKKQCVVVKDGDGNETEIMATNVSIFDPVGVDDGPDNALRIIDTLAVNDLYDPDLSWKKCMVRQTAQKLFAANPHQQHAINYMLDNPTATLEEVGLNCDLSRE